MVGEAEEVQVLVPEELVRFVARAAGVPERVARRVLEAERRYYLGLLSRETEG